MRTTFSICCLLCLIAGSCEPGNNPPSNLVDASCEFGQQGSNAVAGNPDDAVSSEPGITDDELSQLGRLMSCLPMISVVQNDQQTLSAYYSANREVVDPVLQAEKTDFARLQYLSGKVMGILDRETQLRKDLARCRDLEARVPGSHGVWTIADLAAPARIPDLKKRLAAIESSRRLLKLHGIIR